MSSPGQVDNLLATNIAEDDAMESEANALLDDSTSTSEHTEQGNNADEGDAFMEVTPTEVAVKARGV